MFFGSKNNSIYFAVLGFFLLLSQSLFAYDKLFCNLSDAISSNNENAVKKFLEEGANPRNIEYFYPLPSIEIIKLLHNEGKNSLSSSELLNLILNSHNGDKDCENAKDILVKYLIEELKAGYQNIDSIDTYPSLDTSKLLISIGLNPSKFLDLILSYSSHNSDSDFWLSQEAEFKKLKDFAIQNGASSNKFPQIEEALKNKEEFINFNQEFLLKEQVALFLEKYPPANIDTGSVKKLIEKFKKRGHCHGFTTLWLYSKWLQFERQEKIYDKNWFKNTVKDVSLWDRESVLDSTKISNFHKLLSSIDFFQSPRDFIEGMADGDINVHKSKNILNSNGKILKEKYKIASSFASSEQLILLLEKIIHENTPVYVMYPGAPGKPRHSTGLFKYDGKYYLYDPNKRWGEHKYDSIKDVAKAIFDNGYCNENHGIGFIICEFEEEPYIYLSPDSILAEIYKSPYENNVSLGAAAEAAICVRSLDSLLFFLDQGLKPTYEDIAGRSLLNLAILANSPEIVAMLLKKTGVDPNQLIVGEVINVYTQEAKTKGGTGLHLAAQKGYFEIVKIFLDDPRTIIDQKDYSGKTAFDYAIEKKHEKTKMCFTIYLGQNTWQSHEIQIKNNTLDYII